MRWRGIAVAIIVIVACRIALGLASDFLVDWLWFSAVGYFDVFWTIFGAKAILFFLRGLTPQLLAPRFGNASGRSPRQPHRGLFLRYHTGCNDYQFLDPN